MTKRFAERLVLITGAAGGLGRAMAEGFAREGAHLILTDLDQGGLDATKAALGTSVVSVHRIDLAVESEIQAFAAQVCGAHEKLHVLVNNAGIAYGQAVFSFEKLSQAQWLQFLAINSVAPLLLAQALRPALAKARGVVVNQSSMAAYAPATAYGVTKATLNSMTYGMAHVFGADGIRVNAIAPGIMETPASKSQLTAETYSRIQKMQLLDLHGTADDIVSLALFLASDEARFINCEVVHCDAGNRLRAWRE